MNERQTEELLNKLTLALKESTRIRKELQMVCWLLAALLLAVIFK